MIENTEIDVHMSIVPKGETAKQMDQQEKLKPSSAVVQLLRGNPEGLQLNEIQKMLDGKIDTKSTELNRLFYQTLKYLRDNGKVKLEGSCYSLIEEGESGAEVPQV